MFSGIRSRKAPQLEHSLEEGNHRSTAITSRPYHWALYSSSADQEVRPDSGAAAVRTLHGRWILV